MAKLPVTNICDIYQFTRDGDTESYPATPAYQYVNVCISPTGTDVQTSEGGVASYQLFECFIYDTTIEMHHNDKIVTDTNQTYYVAGVPYVMSNQYMQYIRVIVRQII